MFLQSQLYHYSILRQLFPASIQPQGVECPLQALKAHLHLTGLYTFHDVAHSVLESFLTPSGTPWPFLRLWEELRYHKFRKPAAIAIYGPPNGMNTQPRH